MNEHRDSLISNLDQSIAIFAQIRTPDAASVAAFDTLKQARAMIADALEHEQQGSARRSHAAEPVLMGN